MTSAYVVGYDATRVNAAFMPRDAQVYAGYSTGSGDVPWDESLFAAYATALGPCLRIDQDPSASDPTADYLDVEQGAATVGDCAWWAKRALADFKAGTRPGQRRPAIYMSAGNVTPVVNELIYGGVTSGVGLVVANWSIGEAQAIVDVVAASGPFPIVGVQWSDPGPYDIDVYSRAWLLDQSGHPAPPPPPPPHPSPSPVPAWQEAMLNSLPTLSEGADDARLPHWFVHRVQAILNSVYAVQPPVTVDGSFGPATAAAVAEVQHAHGLIADSVIGQQTWALLVTGAA